MSESIGFDTKFNLGKTDKIQNYIIDIFAKTIKEYNAGDPLNPTDPDKPDDPDKPEVIKYCNFSKVVEDHNVTYKQ